MADWIGQHIKIVKSGRDLRAADWRMKRRTCRNWARESWRQWVRIRPIRFDREPISLNARGNCFTNSKGLWKL